jgi:hypothetical protein
MRSVFVDQDSARVGHAHSILESAGIASFVRNNLSHTLVGISIVGPLRIFDPELCVINDEDYERAMELLAGFNPQAVECAPRPDWSCPSCKAAVPASFGECWSCQTLHPEG